MLYMTVRGVSQNGQGAGGIFVGQMTRVITYNINCFVEDLEGA